MQYDPKSPPPAKEWLALSRKQRANLIVEYLRRVRPHRTTRRSYAVTIAAVETQIAIGLPAVCEAMARARHENMSRWGGLCLVGWVFLDTIELSRPGETVHETYGRYSGSLIGRQETGFDDFNLDPC